jgi:acyl homoserine lactone synthase
MIQYLYADKLSAYPKLAESMFMDRAVQFKDRLDWDVTVDENGFELDQYDQLNPLYIIWKDANGRHAGSLRVMPTTGRTMTGEHFLHLTDGVRISSPLIWECTRFCLAPGASSAVAAGLLAAGIELGLRSGLEQAIGVIYTRVLGLYHRFGHSPDVIGTAGEGRDRISVCVWDITTEARASICRKSGIPERMIEAWYEASFCQARANGAGFPARFHHEELEVA